MVFLYINDDPIYIPTSRVEWQGALELQRSLLRLGSRPYPDYVSTVFLDAADIE